MKRTRLLTLTRIVLLQSGSNGMLWPGCGQAQLCPKVLTVADELIHVNPCNLHSGSSAQLWNG